MADLEAKADACLCNWRQQRQLPTHLFCNQLRNILGPHCFTLGHEEGLSSNTRAVKTFCSQQGSRAKVLRGNVVHWRRAF
eukprot:CAMPEP_0172771784 /NCGR_PEP_ID=MMETSP1074-20121228/191162_1 /TAXON_ID=2916 /ORGANISM="Ceratium fusus, Strain PA161109" /LENGTH=79 /DNA_ID=CAMNT_0013607779 /DNA_START=191 /DNA_END=430 /DNA_ORIENTATION=+